MEWTWGPADSWQRLADWLTHLGDSLAARPRAAVVISGHWEEDEFTVTTHPQPPLIYDYYGFPGHTYRLTYPAPGSPEVARRVCELLGEAGIAAGSDGNLWFGEPDQMESITPLGVATGHNLTIS